MLQKLKKTTSSLLAILKNPWLLNLIYDRDSAWAKRFSAAYPSKTELPVYDIRDLLPQSFELSTWAFSGGGSMPTDIALLKAFAASFKDCKYFEIGTWQGESAANIAESAAQIVSLDLPSKELKQLGASEEYIQKQDYFVKEMDKVRLLKGNSLHFDFASLGEKFDLIFIDGDHHYNAVYSDTTQVFNHLIHSDSIVVWHDYAHSPGEVRWEVYKAIYDAVPEELKHRIISFNNCLCAAMLPEKMIKKLNLFDNSNSATFELSLKIK